jgi:hypothetical protein
MISFLRWMNYGKQLCGLPRVFLERNLILHEKGVYSDYKDTDY